MHDSIIFKETINLTFTDASETATIFSPPDRKWQKETELVSSVSEDSSPPVPTSHTC